MHDQLGSSRLDRRQFIGWASRRGAALGAVGLGLPAILAACTDDDPAVGGGALTTTAGGGEAASATGGRAIVGDVVDFALSSDEWAGAFGFVTLRMHKAVVDGADVWFVRTDTSDPAVADADGLVLVPKLASLADARLSGAMYVVEGGVDDQPVVLSSEPGRDGYTPAWRLHRVHFDGDPRRLSSVAEVERAVADRVAAVEVTGAVVNAAVVKWSAGELAVDTERTGYLGPGQLLAPPDAAAGEVTFKLHQCYPASRYIVTEHSIAMAAEMTNTIHAPGLHGGVSAAGATAHTNVFLNGVEGPGPMGFQPSAFDVDAGDPAWSPYWDHYAYRWRDGAAARVLRSEADIHAARDAGELEEFVGTPDMNGELFTVNCPVPVLAAVSWQA